MSLRDVSAKLSCEALPHQLGHIELSHGPSGKVIQSLAIMDALPAHRSFIISTWLKSYKGTARKLFSEDWYDEYEPKIAEGRWQDCVVATDEDGYTVYAWICGGPWGLLHCYVIPELRRLGVAKELIRYCVSHNISGFALARPWPFHSLGGRVGWPVNPYLLNTNARKDS